MLDLIWNHEPNMIAYEIIIQIIFEGGLKLIDIQCQGQIPKNNLWKRIL